MPETAWGVASLQPLNPKSWILVVTSVSAVGGTLVGIVSHAAIFVAVMGFCLAIWSVAGQLISRRLVDRRPGRTFDAVMGAPLMGSAVMLLPQVRPAPPGTIQNGATT